MEIGKVVKVEVNGREENQRLSERHRQQVEQINVDVKGTTKLVYEEKLRI